MGVYIPNMDMPESLGVNLTIYPDGRVCKSDPYSGLKMVATAIELPDGHGRLIDADALIEYCKHFAAMYKESTLRTDKARRDELFSVIGEIINMPTIIQADKEET